MPPGLGRFHEVCGWRRGDGGRPAPARAGPARELVRLQAAEMFAKDADARQVARELRVSAKSVYQWRRAWTAGGDKALASKGADGNPCKLDESAIAQIGA